MQFFVQLIPVLFTGIMLYLTYQLSIALKNGGTGILSDLCWLLEKTPVLDAFVLLLLQAALIVASVFCLFGRVSNHGIISLDILYLANLLILILYHSLKLFNHPRVKEA